MNGSLFDGGYSIAQPGELSTEAHRALLLALRHEPLSVVCMPKTVKDHVGQTKTAAYVDIHIQLKRIYLESDGSTL